MPPKKTTVTASASSTSNPRPLPTKTQLAAIQKYLDQKPDFETLIAQASAAREAEVKPSKSNKSPIQFDIMPEEDRVEGNLTDLKAKESEDSNASWHPLHKNQPVEGVALQHHEANPGPVITRNMPEPESKEDLRKRAEELNKK